MSVLFLVEKIAESIFKEHGVNSLAASNNGIADKRIILRVSSVFLALFPALSSALYVMIS